MSHARFLTELYTTEYTSYQRGKINNIKRKESVKISDTITLKEFLDQNPKYLDYKIIFINTNNEIQIILKMKSNLST